MLGAVFLEHRQGDDRIDVVGDARLDDAAQSGVHVERLVDGQLVDKRVELRTVAEVALGFPPLPRDTLRLEEDVAVSRRRNAGHHLERGRLTGSVDAEQAEALALQASQFDELTNEHFNLFRSK